MRQQAGDFGGVYKRAQVFGIDVGDTQKKVYTPEGTFTGRALVLRLGRWVLPLFPVKEFSVGG